MDSIYYEKVLNRIIQGRLRIKLGDLVLFVYEPDADIIEESFDIYEETYDKAFLSGVFIEQEALEFLLENDLWSPMDDREADKLEKQIDDLKVEAYKNFYDKKRLSELKRQIKNTEYLMADFKLKKKQFSHVTCAGVASFARQSWILSKTTKRQDGSVYGFEGKNISAVLDMYSKESISGKTFRHIARNDPWRPMWQASVKQGNIFGKRACDLDKNQLALISFSQMYDNVHESPEAPKQEIIEDDDCLDGWFIEQRREQEKNKQEKEANDLISNPKIANSQEVFLMARDKDHAKQIYDLNNPAARQTVKAREKQIVEHVSKTGENLHFKNLNDVSLERTLQATNASISNTRSRGK